jgi:DNA invertase Pin-like site-specific DNA recombinase
VHSFWLCWKLRSTFVACDNPIATKSTISILAAAAEHEFHVKSEKIKSSLFAAKARGVKLGSARPGHWHGHEEARLRGAMKATERAAEVRRRAAQQAYVDLYPLVSKLHKQGLSLREIARRLNGMGLVTRRRKHWNPVQVKVVIQRAMQRLE